MLSRGDCPPHPLRPRRRPADLMGMPAHQQVYYTVDEGLAFPEDTRERIGEVCSVPADIS